MLVVLVGLFYKPDLPALRDQTHVEWVNSWVETLKQLQAFVKQHHTTGLVWAKTGAAPPPPPGGLPPPPPVLPPVDSLSLDNSNDRSALFAQINQGSDITKSRFCQYLNSCCQH